IAALAIRLVYLGEMSDSPTFRVPVVDAENYDTIARAIAFGGEINEKLFWQGPLYPLFLAMVYKIGGGSIIAAKVAQIVLGALTCVLVLFIGARIFDRKAGVIAAAITALCGPLIFFEQELLATGWAAFWSAALIFLILETDRRRSIGSYLTLGICAGLGTITRATFLPFIIAAAIWLLVRINRRGRKTGGITARGGDHTHGSSSTATRGGDRKHGWAAVAARGGILALGFLVVAIPIAILCHTETGQFSFLPQSGPINLYIGNNPDTDKTLMIRPGAEWRDLTRLPTVHGSTGGASDRAFFMNRFWGYVKSSPGGYIAGLLGKTVQFLGSRELPRNVDIYIYRRYSRLLSALAWKARGFGFPFGLILPFTLIGLYTYRRRIPLPLFLYAVLYPAAIIFVFVSARYRTPIVPVLAVPAAMGLRHFADSIRKGRLRPAAVMAGVVAAIAFFTSLPGPFATERYDYRAEMHCSVGFELSKRGDLDKAILHLNEALRLRRDYGNAHKFLGLIRNRQRRPDEAVEHLERALAQNPDSYLIRYYLGASLLNLGRTREAIDHLERALAGAETAREEEIAEQIRVLLRAKRGEKAPEMR
ncbi:MAG TPA: glycosyltransferase family 39 protein, partial [Patescibacteria group bacterium]|nr:glycosyltransferase family 39 protein [Patescibacteria group bacterium]